jgi:hypothetical protein
MVSGKVSLLIVALALATTPLGSDAYSFVDPQSLSQKSILQMNTHRREPIRMPSQTPMVPYRVSSV